MNFLLPLILFAAPPADGTDDLREAAPAGGPQDDYGPFYEDVAASDTDHETKPRRGEFPVLSVGEGAFCFVEDSKCRASLIISGDVATGGAIRSGQQGPDLPYSLVTARAGFAVRPLVLSRKQWHPWGIGVLGSYSFGTPLVAFGTDEEDTVENANTQSWRIALLNQIWLSKKPHGFHVDITVGGVRSNVQTISDDFKLWGTHAEVAFGFGGWGGLFVGADFLDQDTRVFLGLRLHGIAAAPVAGLAAAGMAAGGVL